VPGRERFHLTAGHLAYGEETFSLTALMATEARLAAAVAKNIGFSLIEATTHTMNDNSDAAFAANRAVNRRVLKDGLGNCTVHMFANLKKKQYRDKDAHFKPLLDDLKFISTLTLGGGVVELLLRSFERKWAPLEPDVVRVRSNEYTGAKGN